MRACVRVCICVSFPVYPLLIIYVLYLMPYFIIILYPDECLTRPCDNGAQCVDTVGSYSCICALGFSGFPSCNVNIGKFVGFVVGSVQAYI